MARKKKRTYKALTQWQEKKIKVQSKAGWSQERISLNLGVAKFRVNKYLQTKSIGKRRAPGTSLFWGDVEVAQRQQGFSYKEATRRVGLTKFWGEKRAVKVDKKYKRIADFWKEAEEAALTKEEIAQKWKDESEEFYFGTPV